MDIIIFIFLAPIAIVLIYGIMLYNQLVDLKHTVSQAWSNIDILLKQRHDELPKLVEPKDMTTPTKIIKSTMTL